MSRELSPPAGLVDQVAATVRRLCAQGEDAIYEVDVISACHPAPPWEVRQAFYACVERGLLEPSARQPAAFLPRASEPSR